MFCSNCGAQMRDGETFCTSCGQPLDTQPTNGSNTQNLAKPAEKRSKNGVATALQVYAIVNAAVGFFGGLLYGDVVDNFAAGMLIFAVCLFASFFIYSFGEVVKLLNEIKENTRIAANQMENKQN